jgi:hypothetical protein
MTAPVLTVPDEKQTGEFHVDELVQPEPVLMYDPLHEMMSARPLPVTSTNR